MRVGIDLGGTKTEIIVLNGTACAYRHRVATPSHDYQAIIDCIEKLIAAARSHLSLANNWPAAVGVAMPGALDANACIKNSNTLVLNGRALQADLQQQLQCPVSLMNDANCFALSESIDGAAADIESVFGVILGTGVGGGFCLQQRLVLGVNRLGGEWGHNILPMNAPRVQPELSRTCYCGKQDCIETYLCGQGLLRSYTELFACESPSVEAIFATASAESEQLLLLYSQQLAASLAMVVHIIDPSVIVLGGGLSNIAGLAECVQEQLLPFIFGGELQTQVRRHLHGDSSGVRGAAWL